VNIYKKCLICGDESEDKREFGIHLQFTHFMKIEDYIIRYYHDGIRPLCLICDSETRYSHKDFSFRRYCINHAREAMKEGGKKGGKSTSWNKGLTKENDERMRLQAENQKGKNNSFYGRSHSEESKDKIRNIKKISKEDFLGRIGIRQKEFINLTDYDEYYSRQHQYLLLRCVICNLEQGKTLQAFERGSLCSQCFPNASISQVEILEFIKKLGFRVISGDRSIISPYELDLYIPDKDLAIEYNSLYYHREDGPPGYDKKYHKNKTILCKDKGIRLLHIFGDEWSNKKEIIKSMIKNRLGVADIKIGARSCSIIEIDKKVAKKFFEENHIDGYGRNRICFGLVYNGELVCGIALRIPMIRNKYKGKIEIGRFVSKRGYLVMGGFSKLLKKCISWSSDGGFAGIITYADLRFGEGKVYLSNGFDFIRDTGLNYWYTDDVVRYDRFRFRAQSGKSEKEVAQENKVYRIYGCGNYLYEYKFNNE